MNSVHYPQNVDPASVLEITIDIEKTRSSCEAYKKQIISQALNDAAKDACSVDSIIDDTVKVNMDQVNVVESKQQDVIDRFFGFAESVMCSSDNTTNVNIDPKLLAKEERTALCACGGQDAEEIAQAELLVANICKEVLEQMDEGKALEKNGSDDTGVTDAETIDGAKEVKKSRFRFWKTYNCCIGEEVEESVLHTEPSQVCAQ